MRGFEKAKAVLYFVFLALTYFGLRGFSEIAPRTVHFAFAGICLLTWLWAFLAILNKLFTDLVNQTKDSAYDISKIKWFVKGAAIFEKSCAFMLNDRGWHGFLPSRVNAGCGWSVLKLSSANPQRVSLMLFFPPGHPSLEFLRALDHLDLVEFELIPKPIKPEWSDELAGYLLLKAPIL
jgi:hypothetical protein